MTPGTSRERMGSAAIAGNPRAEGGTPIIPDGSCGSSGIGTEYTSLWLGETSQGSDGHFLPFGVGGGPAEVDLAEES